MAFVPTELRQPHPVTFDVEYQEGLSRLSTFFRLILVIPQLFVVYLLQTVLMILTVLAWFAILFTARYPKSFFEFSQGVLRWNGNVVAYGALLRDEYPPFATDAGKYPVTLAFERPERQSRFRLFIRIFAIIPNYIVYYFVQLAWLVTTMIAWFAIVFTGRRPGDGDVELSINGLSSLFTGYASAGSLRMAGLLRGGTPRDHDLLTAAFTTATPSTVDFY